MKNLSIDSVTGLPIFTNQKDEIYSSILVIVNLFIKMFHYEFVNIIINVLVLAKIIIEMVVKHHSLPNSIACNQDSVFILKFRLSLCYFFKIKQKLSTASHPPTDDQTKSQNSTIKAYLGAFINFAQVNQAGFLPITKFTHNNAKNASNIHTFFKLHYDYQFQISCKKDVVPQSQSKSANKLATKFRELRNILRKKLQHAQKLQKQYNNKATKLMSYVTGNKVWLNSKYIKTKQTCKLEAKFFGSFRVLYSIKKQAYKLKLPKKQKIYNVFHISLLEQDITKKGQVDKIMPSLKIDEGNSKKYKINVICNSKVYTKKLDSGHLLGFYYLVS